MASKQSPPTPDAGCHETATSQPSSAGIVDGRSLRWIRRASSSSRRSTAACCRRARPASTSVRRIVDQLRVVPWLLNEVAHAEAHGLDREVDRSPAGHDDDRELPIERLHARQQVDALAARRSCRRCSSGPSSRRSNDPAVMAESAASGDPADVDVDAPRALSSSRSASIKSGWSSATRIRGCSGAGRVHGAVATHSKGMCHDRVEAKSPRESTQNRGKLTLVGTAGCSIPNNASRKRRNV